MTGTLGMALLEFYFSLPGIGVKEVRNNQVKVHPAAHGLGVYSIQMVHTVQLVYTGVHCSTGVQ